MRKISKKLLSFLLVVSVLAGSFIFAIPAMADTGVTLVTNGGTLASTEPVAAGDKLPTFEGISNNGAIFDGWYADENFTGGKVTVAEAGATYYAKWYSTARMIADFEDGTVWSAWNSKGQSGALDSVSLNEDSAHVFGGTKSMKVVAQNIYNADHTGPDKQRIMVAGWYGQKFAADSDGIYLYVESNYETVICIMVNAQWHDYYNGGVKHADVSIPIGKSLVMVPWSAYASTIDENTTINYITIVSKGRWSKDGTSKGELYIDDIATYKEYVKPNLITYNLNDGAWAEGYTAPTSYTAAATALPTFENVKKEGYIFGGWYDNADLNGTAIKATPESGDITLYAKWLKVVQTLNDFEAATDTSKGIYGWTNAGRGTYTTEINTDAAYASSGTKSAKLTTKYGNNAKEDGLTNDWMRWGAWATYLEYHNDDAADGISFWVNSAYETTLKIYSNCYTADSTSGGVESAVKTIPAGKSYVTFTWEELGATKPWNIVIMPFCVWNFRNDIYVDDIATYDDPTIYEPSYGVATPAKGGMFAAGDAGANEAAGIDNITGAIYEIDGVKYTAFRVFGTYVAPNDESTPVPAPDYGKIVVDANGTAEAIVSRHVMLGSGAEPTLDKYYVKTDVTSNFDKCWSAEQNPDGTWTVTYSLLLKGIPEAYAATSFYAGSAVVTANGTYAGNSINNVSAQVMYEAMGDTTITWFTNAQ